MKSIAGQTIAMYRSDLYLNKSIMVYSSETFYYLFVGELGRNYKSSIISYYYEFILAILLMELSSSVLPDFMEKCGTYSIIHTLNRRIKMHRKSINNEKIPKSNAIDFGMGLER
jgi:hypothetical protein